MVQQHHRCSFVYFMPFERLRTSLALPFFSVFAFGTPVPFLVQLFELVGLGLVFILGIELLNLFWHLPLFKCVYLTFHIKNLRHSQGLLNRDTLPNKRLYKYFHLILLSESG